MTAKKLIRNVMAAFIVALAIILAVVIFRGVEESKMVEEPSEPAPQTKVDVTLQKVRYTETSEGVRKWTLVADGVEYWREKEMSRLENVEITFYRQDSDNDVILTAREGKFHLEMHWWHAVHFALWNRLELLEKP